MKNIEVRKAGFVRMGAAVVIVTAMCAVSLAACGGGSKSGETGEAAAPAGGEKGADGAKSGDGAAAGKVGGDVVAVVDGKSITTAMLNEELKRFPEAMARTAAGRRYVLDRAIENLLIEREAELREIEKDPEVSQRLRSFRQQVLRDALAEKIQSGGEVSDAEADEYFAQNANKVNRPEQVRAAHIVFAPNDKALAESTLRDIKAKKTTFEEAARTFSIEKSSGMRGGDLGYFAVEQRPGVGEQAFKLKNVGELSAVFESRAGWHIVKLLDRRPAMTLNPEQARAVVKERIRAERSQNAERTMVKDLREKAQITVDEVWVSGAAPSEGGAAAAPAAAPDAPAAPAAPAAPDTK